MTIWIIFGLKQEKATVKFHNAMLNRIVFGLELVFVDNGAVEDDCATLGHFWQVRMVVETGKITHIPMTVRVICIGGRHNPARS